MFYLREAKVGRCGSRSRGRTAPREGADGWPWLQRPRSGSDGRLQLERDGGGVHDRGDAHRVEDVVFAEPAVEDGLLVGADAHLAAVDGADREREELEID